MSLSNEPAMANMLTYSTSRHLSTRPAPHTYVRVSYIRTHTHTHTHTHNGKHVHVQHLPPPPPSLSLRVCVCKTCTRGRERVCACGRVRVLCGWHDTHRRRYGALRTVSACAVRVWACAHVGACMRLTAGWVEGPARDEVPQNPAVARVHDRGRAAKEVCVHAAPARAR